MEKNKNNPHGIDAPYVISTFKDKSWKNGLYPGYESLPNEEETQETQENPEEEIQDVPKEEAQSIPKEEIKEPLETTPQPRGNNRKKKTELNYKELFIRPTEFKTRQCVYISKEIHSVISRFVNSFADKDITVGGFVNNILVEHLDNHKDDINEIFTQSQNKLL